MSNEATPRPKRLAQTLDRAREAAGKATELARDVAEVASGTARDIADIAEEKARAALQKASEGAQVVAQLAEDGAKVAAQFAGDTARVAGKVAQEVALQMAQTYLKKSSLKLDISESQLNKQVRHILRDKKDIDHIAIYCGEDRLKVAASGHFRRVAYTLELYFDVLECKVSRSEQYLIVRQVDEALDAQLKHSNFATNWATRQIANRAFKMANKLPTKSPVNQILESLPGVRHEGLKRWRIDLGRTVMVDLLANRSWMVDKLLGLSDLGELPGLTTLKDSNEMLLLLVNQLDIRDMRVRPGRLELLVGLNAD